VNDKAKPLRLFVAASLPESELKRIDSETKDLRDRLVGARWAPIENQHVTLKFLGATPPEDLADVEAIVSAVAAAHRPAELSVEGLGVFPSIRRARVLWAGVRDETTLMSSLAAELAGSFAAMGYQPEKRKFTPHLTLARFRQPVPVDKDRLRLERGAPFRLEGIELFRSHLSPKGALYELLRTFDLGAGKEADG
jgi:RNA 2',3'-cyclic 3'-phosphodiesterase